jgi:hypothetical protein
VLASAAFSSGAAAAATVVSRTAAQQKLSQGDAKSQTAPKGDQRCEGCANFRAPNGCKFVQGDISPASCCREVLTAKCIFRGALTAPAFPSARSSASKQANSL